MPEEKKLQTKILNDLRSFKKYCEVFKIIKSSDNGTPDIFFTTTLTGGVFIETKRKKGVKSKLQCLKIIKLNMCGCKSFLCNTWEDWLCIKLDLGLTKDKIINSYESNNSVLV